MQSFAAEKAIAAALAEKTDFEREEEARFQESERLKLAAVNSPETRRRIIGQERIRFALEQLKLNAADAEFDRLAEGYALAGDFEKAAAYAKSPARLTEYADIQTAINRSADEICECPKKKNNCPTYFIKDRFYEANKYQQNVNLWFCVLCRFSNATP